MAFLVDSVCHAYPTLSCKQRAGSRYFLRLCTGFGRSFRALSSFVRPFFFKLSANTYVALCLLCRRPSDLGVPVLAYLNIPGSPFSTPVSL